MVSDLGLRERTRVFENGQQVIECLDKQIESALASKDGQLQWPVALVILDINMPILNGFETMAQINARFAQVSQERLARPLVCFMTQMEGYGLRPLLAKEEQADALF